MPYTWSLDPEDLFAERYPQMTRQNLPPDDVDGVRARIQRMWADESGGWVYEWSRLAEGYARKGRHDQAMLAYGWAKFPTLANEAGQAALAKQVEQCELWSRQLPIDFERRILTVPYGSGTTNVPVHILSPKGAPTDTPILLASGGVDTWKMDLQSLFLLYIQHTGVRILAFDIPGTGESQIPMSPEGSQVVSGLIAAARAMGARKVGHLGISMGGYYSARSGLAGEVDAAIDLGGPVGASETPPAREWHFGMADIMGNALRLDRPDPREVAKALDRFTLRPLLAQAKNAPMLVINGADDIHIPAQDTLVFEGRSNTEVLLLPETGHCAVTKMDVVIPKMLGWTAQQLR
ncbi:fermentation/respiration switch protein [compost metagenome]